MANWQYRLEHAEINDNGVGYFVRSLGAWLWSWMATAPAAAKAVKGAIWQNLTNGLLYSNVGTVATPVWTSPNVLLTEAEVAPGASVEPTNHVAYKFSIADPNSAIALAGPKFEGQMVRAECVAVQAGEDGVDWLTITNADGFDALGTQSLKFWKAGQWALLVGVRTAADAIKWRVVGSNLTPFVAAEAALEAGDGGDKEPVPVDTNASFTITTAAAETNTLAAPTFEGQEIALEMLVRNVGDRVITVATGLDGLAAGSTMNTMTFGAAGDRIVLKAVRVGANLRWRVAYNQLVALSHV